MNTLINFIKGKSWVFLTTLLAAAVFAFIDFPYFNEILHGVVKVGVLFLSLGIFRNLFFRKTLKASKMNLSLSKKESLNPKKQKQE